MDSGVDFKLFSVIAAFSQRVAVLEYVVVSSCLVSSKMYSIFSFFTSSPQLKRLVLINSLLLFEQRICKNSYFEAGFQRVGLQTTTSKGRTICVL